MPGAFLLRFLTVVGARARLATTSTIPALVKPRTTCERFRPGPLGAFAKRMAGVSVVQAAPLTFDVRAHVVDLFCSIGAHPPEGIIDGNMM